MLCLPHGRVVEIDFYPLHELADRARRERNAALLLFLENEAHLLSLVLVDEVCGDCLAEIGVNAVEAHTDPCGVTLRPTGFSVTNILAGRACWPRAHRHALRVYLRSAGVHARLKWLQRDLLCLRARLTDRAILRPDRRRFLPSQAAPAPRAFDWRDIRPPVAASDAP